MKTQKYANLIVLVLSLCFSLALVNEPEQIVAETVTETVAPVSPSIAEVRQSPQEQVYTVRGKIISPINGWGGQGFYIQDNSGVGLYIYPRTSLGYQTGDTVQLTGTLGSFNGELQLSSISQHQKVETNLETKTTDLSLADLSQAPQATLIRLQEVTVGAIETDQYQNALFTVTDKDGRQLSVRLDSRTGTNHSQLLTKIDQGDTINLTGILTTYRDQAQLKPFSLDQFELVEKATQNQNQNPSQGDSHKIGQLQGASHTSPLVGRAVRLQQVVVTYVDSRNRFYVQDLVPDEDGKTSNGITVYQANASVAVGDVLDLSGTVEEYFGSGYDDRRETDLSITQIRAQSLTKTGTSSVPAPLILGQDSSAPAGVIDNDGLTVFDPQEDALDYWESLEGMLVAVDNARIVGPIKNRELYVLPGTVNQGLNQVGASNLSPTGPSTSLIALLLKNGRQTAKAGDSLSGRVTGPVSYSYTNYKVLVDDASLPAIQDGGLTAEKTTLTNSEDKLTIASYNIENFSADPKSTSNEKVERIAQSFVGDLKSPDIIGLVEVQDNNAATDDGTTDASQSAQRLIDAILAQGGPAYTYLDIAPDNNQDGGQAGANIRVGFLYNPARVSLSDKPKAGANEGISWQGGELSHSLGRIDPTNPNWANTRKSLVAEFVFKGQKVVVLANHLNSKRGDTGLYGRQQPANLASEPKRHALASMLNQFAKEGLSQNPDSKIVMLGDFNDYEFTQTSKIIEEDALSNLVSRHDEADRFSYFYQGSYQSLDNIFLSNNLLSRYAFDMVHVNAPFMEAHGRASDHDPLLVQLDLGQSSPAVVDQTSSSGKAPQSSQTTGEVSDSVDSRTTPRQRQMFSKTQKRLPRTGHETSWGLVGLGTCFFLLVIASWSRSADANSSNRQHL